MKMYRVRQWTRVSRRIISIGQQVPKIPYISLVLLYFPYRFKCFLETLTATKNINTDRIF